jgi:sugar phosphate isomerase/epimerase
VTVSLSKPAGCVVAKDCAGPHFLEREVGAPPFGTANPDPRGDEVMIQFGTGKVDFAGVFTKLKSSGFSGPIMVEGTAVGATLQETIANARANREFLEKDCLSRNHL